MNRRTARKQLSGKLERFYLAVLYGGLKIFMINEQPGTRSKKILVVDDNKVVLRAITMVLRSNGYEVVTAIDGSEAVSVVERETPDLILLDILFPPDPMEVGMHWDGFAIIRWLRNMSAGKSVPVIIISGTEPAKYKSRCLEAGAQAFLQKPLAMDELIATIHTLLEKGPARTTA